VETQITRVSRYNMSIVTSIKKYKGKMLCTMKRVGGAPAAEGGTPGAVAQTWARDP